MREQIKNDVPDFWRQRAKAGLCPVCGKDPSEFDKNMRVYCSRNCREKYAEKYTFWSTLREKILERDKNTCQICKNNSEKFHKEAENKEKQNYQEWIKKHRTELEKYRDQALVRLSERFEHEYNEIMDDIRFAKRHLPYEVTKKLQVDKYFSFSLEVDHIEAVALWGDMWDENNLRTICTECHKKKTKKDMEKIKIENLRKDNQQLSEVEEIGNTNT